MVALRHSRVRVEGSARHRDLVPRGTYARYLPSPVEAEAEAEAKATVEAEAKATVEAEAKATAEAEAKATVEAEAKATAAAAPAVARAARQGQEGMVRTFRAFAVGEADGAAVAGAACGLDPGLSDTLARIRQLLSAGPGAVAAAPATHPAVRVPIRAQAVQARASRA